jgi:signal transduction histidine kinase
VGIGLALVRGLVEMHGATVVYSDGEGRGSEFVVRLPLLRDAMAADPA